MAITLELKVVVTRRIAVLSAIVSMLSLAGKPAAWAHDEERELTERARQV